MGLRGFKGVSGIFINVSRVFDIRKNQGALGTFEGISGGFKAIERSCRAIPFYGSFRGFQVVFEMFQRVLRSVSGRFKNIIGF